MLILRTSPSSPFGRKVRIAIDVVGLTGKVEVKNADTGDAADSLREQNPLGKIPTLIVENGDALFDSRVIVEYLNALDGRGILIPAGLDGVAVLRLQALADGIMDAALLQMYEKRFRPATHHVAAWLDHQQGKVERSLAHLEQNVPAVHGDVPNIGDIALACALGYLDFRFDGEWRVSNPALADWLAGFVERTPAFARTAP
jgi:glutathione S-transferase